MKIGRPLRGSSRSSAPRMGANLSRTRLFLESIFWIARTAAPRRDPHEGFGKLSNVYQQFRRWAFVGLREDIMEAPRMIDSIVTCAPSSGSEHQMETRDRVLAPRGVASRSTYIPAFMQQAQRRGPKSHRGKHLTTLGLIWPW